MTYILIALSLLNGLSAGISQTEQSGIDPQMIGLWEPVRHVGVCKLHEVAFAFSDIEPGNATKIIKCRSQRKFYRLKEQQD